MEFFYSIFIIIFSILFHSSFLLTGLDPGLVDSPPTSIISAPNSNKLNACFNPAFFLLNLPPSEKLSGVKFNYSHYIGNFFKI